MISAHILGRATATQTGVLSFESFGEREVFVAEKKQGKQLSKQRHGGSCRGESSNLVQDMLPALMLEDFDCNAIHMQGSGKMTVQVKTPKEKQAVEVEEGATIKQVGGMDDFFISIDQESFISLETDADLLSF